VRVYVLNECVHLNLDRFEVFFQLACSAKNAADSLSDMLENIPWTVGSGVGAGHDLVLSLVGVVEALVGVVVALLAFLVSLENADATLQQQAPVVIAFGNCSGIASCLLRNAR